MPSRSLRCALALAPFIASACSGGAAQLTPLGPTPAVAMAGQDAGPTAGVDRSRDQANPATVAAWAANHRWSVEADDLEVEGTDVITVIGGGPCPNVVITVRGVPVVLNADTVFRPGLTCAGLAVGQRVHVRGILMFIGDSVTVLATRLQLEGAVFIEGEGVVAAVTGSCPTLTITLQGVDGTILTSPATVFAPAGGCHAIAPGRPIEVKGVLTGPRQLTATELEIEGAVVPALVELEGRVQSVQGGCPELTLTVRGITVRTSAATRFDNGRCRAIRRGTEIEVRGTRIGTEILADRIDVDDDDDDDDDDGE